MNNEPSSDGLVAPRRRNEQARPVYDRQADSGVPVISSLPSLAKTSPSTSRAGTEHPQRERRPTVATAAPVAEPRRIVNEPVAARKPEPPAVAVPIRDHASQSDKRPQLLSAIATMPWNNLLLGLGLAGLLVLALLAASRSGPAIVAPTTPPVHYHITPPHAVDPALADASAAERSIGPSLTPAESQSNAPADAAPRLARKAADQRTSFPWQQTDRQRANSPASEPPVSDGDDGATWGVTIERDDAAIGSPAEYPATEFPDLPLPTPPSSHGASTAGATLNGNIEEFKK